MSYICETCGEETSVITEGDEPVSQCCDDYVMDGTRRLTAFEYLDHRQCNEADDRNDRERERL